MCATHAASFYVYMKACQRRPSSWHEVRGQKASACNVWPGVLPIHVQCDQLDHERQMHEKCDN